MNGLREMEDLMREYPRRDDEDLTDWFDRLLSISWGQYRAPAGREPGEDDE